MSCLQSWIQQKEFLNMQSTTIYCKYLYYDCKFVHILLVMTVPGYLVMSGNVKVYTGVSKHSNVLSFGGDSGWSVSVDELLDSKVTDEKSCSTWHLALFIRSSLLVTLEMPLSILVPAKKEGKSMKPKLLPNTTSNALQIHRIAYLLYMHLHAPYLWVLICGFSSKSFEISKCINRAQSQTDIVQIRSFLYGFFCNADSFFFSFFFFFCKERLWVNISPNSLQ